ncbi:MAG: glycosyltransferase [Flavobacterium sp.]|nr:glycosyltransferase [Flavobacterium sp.]
MVSVCITAYNIDKYLVECVESILIQETNFNYEIVVGEDFSSDNTIEILKSYESRFPNIFRIIYNEKNIGMMPNFIKTIEASNGKYVALMDGDDVWLDKYKLQKQIDFLEENQDYSLCFHDSVISDSKLNPIVNYSHRYPSRYHTYKDGFLIENIVSWRGILGATSSIVFVKKFKRFPDWVKDLYGLEPMIYHLLIEYGKYHYLPETMSAYRVHNNSTDMSFTKISKAQRDIKDHYIYCRYYRPKFINYYYRKIIFDRAYLVFQYFKSFDIKNIIMNSLYYF